MKRLVVLNTILCVMLLLNGCGNEAVDTTIVESETALETDEVNEEDHIIGGILPTRIENIDQGGTIPEGCEAKRSAEEGDYMLEMLWGTWVPEGSGKTGEMPDTDKTILLGEGEDAIEIMCWPERLTFVPAWAGGDNSFGFISDGRSLALNDQKVEARNATLSFGEPSMGFWEEDLQSENNSLGIALEANGFGFGKAEYKIAEKKQESAKLYIDPIKIGDIKNQRKIAYMFDGDVLAVGFTDVESDENVTGTDIKEIDYIVSWIGSKLELTYDGESLVYVPEQIEKGFGVDIVNAGPVSDSDIVDGICGIGVTSDVWDGNNFLEEAVMYDIHEGYIEASYQFEEDGSLLFDSAVGGRHKYTYLYSGDSLTLIADGKPYVYSLYTYKLQSPANKATYTLFVNENQLRLPGSDVPLEWFIEKGFTTDYDLSQLIVSCQVTNIISLGYNGTQMDVKVVNPYENPTPLGKCCVCYIYIDDISGVITKGDGTEINRSTYDEVEFLYDIPYEKTDNMLRYKGSPSVIITDLTPIDFNNRILLDIDGDVEVIYDFRDGILKDYRIEMPSLLYNGLQDNVDASILTNMEPAKFSGIIEVRDSILDRLKSSFQDANVNVDVNDSTGEIVLDNDILFGFDQTVLSDEGKQYIDNFMGIYAAVITDNAFSDYIDEVRFEGHTDSFGSYNYNLELSKSRAEAVLDYCLNSDRNGISKEQKEVLRDLSSTIGYSYSDLVYNDEGKEDADASRRVAIKFYIKVSEN